jgi:hypothetical protein
MGEEIDGAMQQAPQPGRQGLWVEVITPPNRLWTADG